MTDRRRQTISQHDCNCNDCCIHSNEMDPPRLFINHRHQYNHDPQPYTKRTNTNNSVHNDELSPPYVRFNHNTNHHNYHNCKHSYPVQIQYPTPYRQEDNDIDNNNNNPNKKRRLNDGHNIAIYKNTIESEKEKYKLLQEKYNLLEKLSVLEKRNAENELNKVNDELKNIKQQKESINKQWLTEKERNKEYNSLKDINIKQQKVIDDLSDKYNRLIIIIAALRDKSLNGHEPNRKILNYIKLEDKKIKRTITVHGFKEKLKINTNKHISVNNKYKQKVLEYRKLNQENQEKYTNPITTVENKKLNDICEIFKIQSHRSAQLIGECGLRVKCDSFVSNNNILGRLTGIECTEKEWDDTFWSSNCYNLNMKYLYNFTVKLTRRKKEIMNVTIDPIEGGNANLGLLYINDCRRTTAMRTSNDEKGINCEWIQVKIDGWIHVMLRTTKDIYGGTELIMDYGDEYWERMIEQKDYFQRDKQLRQETTDNILQNTDIGDTHNHRELYCL